MIGDRIGFGTCKDEAVPVHAIKAGRACGGIAVSGYWIKTLCL